MKLEYFQYLVMLKKAGSINKSAVLLHTSPQNVSRVLKLLEDELNVELVNRSLSGIEFTEAGLGAIALGEKMIELFEEYSVRYHTNNTIEGELNVFATKIQSTVFMSNIVMKFSKLYPKIKLNYVENDFLICMEKIKNIKNSVGLVPILNREDLPHGMTLNKINSERIAIIVERDSILGKQKEVKYDLLKNKKIVIHTRNDYEDGFWSKIVDKYINDYEDIFIASNGYLFFSKILTEGYIGLGCEKISLMSESMQREEIRSNIAIIPIVDEFSLFNNCLVVPDSLVKDPKVTCLYNFLMEK